MRRETLWMKKQLETFLLKHRVEVKMMILSEYNEELHLKNEREIAREEGMEAGRKAGMEAGRKAGLEEGILRGENRLNTLYQQLLDDKRLDDLKRVPTDRAFQEKLMAEYNII
jgi:flagellar biosynthesis/type III secretory pathway protein FliH